MVFRVLSIDGGGMRGIYISAYLEALERAFARQTGNGPLDIGKAFNLIVGTSTGGIIGCGLAKGVTPSDMVRLYKDNGKKIFPARVPKGFGPRLLKQIFTRPRSLRSGEMSLRAALEEIFKDMTFGQLFDERGIAMAIPAVNMETYQPRVFKTPHNIKTDHSDTDRKIVDICLATSAAPIYRALAILENPQGGNYDVFADGGVWANNPVMVGITEALRILDEKGDSDTPIEIYCLGSCGEPKGEVIGKKKAAMGFKGWKFGAKVVDLSIAAQENAFGKMADLLIPHFKRKIQVIKFPAGKIPTGLTKYLDLDETSAKGINALISKAQDDARATNSEVQSKTPIGVLIEALFSPMETLKKEP